MAVLVLIAAGAAQGQDSYEWKGGKWTKSAPPAKGTPEGELSLVRKHMRDGKYKKAVKAAKKFLDRYPDSELMEDVSYLAGNAEFARKRYFQAFEWYETQLDYSPRGRYYNLAVRKEYEIAEKFLAGEKRIALGMLRLSAKAEALEILTRVAEHVPGTPLAKKAIMRIADWKFDKQKWLEAADAYDVFIDSETLPPAIRTKPPKPKCPKHSSRSPRFAPRRFSLRRSSMSGHKSLRLRPTTTNCL